MSHSHPSVVGREAGPQVGRHFAGYSSRSECTAVFYCEGYDPSLGYWLVNLADPGDRILAYPSELGTDYLPARDRGDHWYVWRSGERLPKSISNAA